jgi:hypothetical protein
MQTPAYRGGNDVDVGCADVGRAAGRFAGDR